MTEQQDTLDAEVNVAGASYQGDNVKHLAIFFLQFFCSTSNRPHRGNTLQDKMLGTKRFKAAFCFPMESPQKPKRPTTETIPRKNQRETANEDGTMLLHGTELALHPLSCQGGTSAVSAGLRGAGQRILNHGLEGKVSTERKQPSRNHLKRNATRIFHHCFPICPDFFEYLFYL